MTGLDLLTGEAPMTLAQLRKLTALWKRSDEYSFKEFLAGARRYFGDYIGVEWCGILVGIETDGYSHT